MPVATVLRMSAVSCHPFVDLVVVDKIEGPRPEVVRGEVSDAVRKVGVRERTGDQDVDQGAGEVVVESNLAADLVAAVCALTVTV
jgi:hypothetical protein